MSKTPSLPLLPPVAAKGYQARHFLALPDDVGVDEVEVLAASRFVATTWEVVPRDLRGADLPAGRIAGPGEPGVLRLTRHTTLTGPYSPAGDGFDAGLDAASAAIAFDVVCPRERWPQLAPFEGGDKDGVVRSFPSGLPNREEGRVITWLVAAARRLGGSVRLDVGGMWDTTGDATRIGTGVLLTPDPGACIERTVYTDIWLEPAACEQVAQGVDDRAHLAMQTKPYEGPPPEAGKQPLVHGSTLTDDERRALHESADAFDIAALQEPQVLAGYGITVDGVADGVVAIEVTGEDTVPLVLRGVPWAKRGCIVYRVRWFAPDDVDANRERPSNVHVAARARAADLITQLTQALWAAVRGEIADETGFLIDPDDL